MKKVMIALMCVMCGVAAMADTATNVYNFSMSLYTPTLLNGVRSKTAQKYTGYMYMEYVDSELAGVWAEVVSSKTKVYHSIAFNDGFYNLLGKQTKTIDRSVPTLYFTGADTEASGGIVKYGEHELITVINFAGFGTLKAYKNVTTGCSACGLPQTHTEYCHILNTASGSVNGVMDCECPDTEPDWWHTLKAAFCGVWYDASDNWERSHKAAFTGTWKISYNKKLSQAR